MTGMCWNWHIHQELLFQMFRLQTALLEFVAKPVAIPHQRLPLITHKPHCDFTSSSEETFCSHWAHSINHIVSETERDDFRNFKSFSLYSDKRGYALSVLSIIKIKGNICFVFRFFSPLLSVAVSQLLRDTCSDQSVEK